MRKVTEVQCLRCRRISSQDDSRATSWDCACGSSYVLRRCSGCGSVSEVSSLQNNGQPWDCMWCQAPNAGFARRKDPAEATLADFARAMTEHGQAFARPARPEPAPAEPMLIVTMNEIPGFRITQVHGDVFGLIVRSRSMVGNFGAQFEAAFGGEVTGYTKLLIDSRDQARQRMWREARARGANAVVAMRFDCNEISTTMSEIAAYGTAVTVEPADSPA